MSSSTRSDGNWTESEFAALDESFPEGMSVQQIVATVTGKGDKLTEPTFRKYVQLGLLPRSVRVGRKGKHRGSQGLYPTTVVRQIVQIRRLMAEGFTMEEIQSEFLFVRGDIEALVQKLEHVFSALEGSSRTHADEMVARSIKEARSLSKDLVTKLEAVERRLSMRARMSRAVV